MQIKNKKGVQFGYWKEGFFTGDHIAVIYQSKLKFKYVQKCLNNDISVYTIDKNK